MERKSEGHAEYLFKNLGKKLDKVIENIKKISDEPGFRDRMAELRRNGDKLEEYDRFKVRHSDFF